VHSSSRQGRWGPERVALQPHSGRRPPEPSQPRRERGEGLASARKARGAQRSAAHAKTHLEPAARRGGRSMAGGEAAARVRTVGAPRILLLLLCLLLVLLGCGCCWRCCGGCRPAAPGWSNIRPPSVRNRAASTPTCGRCCCCLT